MGVIMKDFFLKKVTSLEKVFPAKEPTGEGMTDMLTALKGETVSFQTAYKWMGPERAYAQVTIVSSIKEHVRVRAVQLVPCAYAAHPDSDEDYLFYEPSLAPDLLTDMSETSFQEKKEGSAETKDAAYNMDLIRGQWRSLWIDLEADEGLEAGCYPVSIFITKDEQMLGEVHVTFEILNAQLPKLPICHTEWFHTDCLANYYEVEVFSEEYWRIVENFVRTAAKRRCNMLLTPVFTPPLDTAVGGERRTVQLVDVTVTENGYVFGYEKLERWVEMCRRCGIVYFEISHLFTQWGAAHAPKIMGMSEGREKQLFGWDTAADGPEYVDFLHQFLQSFRKELDRLGISDVTYFHVSDEPRYHQLDSYRTAREIVAKDLEGFQMIDALSDYKFYEEGLVAQPACALDHIGPFLEKRPEKLWGYYCTAQYLDVPNRFMAQPGYRTRILGTLLYRYELDGFLHWGYNYYNTMHSTAAIDPYRVTDADGAFPSGDSFLVYPGVSGSPEESVRLMLMDEAMSDLCAMTLLERLEGREAALECLEAELTFDSYPRSITYLINLRAEVNRRIRESISNK